MSDETNTQPGGGEALPAQTSTTPPAAKPVPRNDAEAAALEQQERETQPDEATKAAAEKAEQEKAERKKNRTREYINKINRENAELRQWRAEQEARAAQPAPSQRQPAAATAADGEPTLEEHDFDVAKFQRAHSAWAVEQALKAEREKTQQVQTTQQQRQVVDSYNERIADFADEHPDFPEVVGSIAYPLSSEVQLAIMAHEKGAEIAYHLGNNDDDAFALASIQPHLAAAAVQRIASRLTAAPPQAPTQPTPTPKPVSQTPPPVPTVSGRSPTETPTEKLTDDEWFKRRQRKK